MLNERPSDVIWALRKALDGLPSVVSWALKKVLDELPSVVIWVRRRAVDELPPVVRWLSRKALNDLPVGLLVQLQQVRATHARTPNPLSATRCDGPASFGG